MRFSIVAVIATLFAAVPGFGWADGPKIGPHGGPRMDIGAYHAELVLDGTEVVLYVTDGTDKPVDVAGAKVEATILANRQIQKVILEPAGGNVLKGRANLPTPHDGVKVVAALTMPGQRLSQARFELGGSGH